MVALIDTNVIIRFLVGDHEEYLAESTKIFDTLCEDLIQKSRLSSGLATSPRFSFNTCV